MKLSIVTTCYCSEKYIDEFYRRSVAVAEEVAGESYEIIFVNDGSPDSSKEKIIEIISHDPHVTLIDLSKNFGHHRALMTGLANASGERVFLLDVDLEEHPEWLLTFLEKMDQEQCDVVFGAQKKRKCKWFEVTTGGIFWKLFNLLSGLNITPNMVTARVMTKQFVESTVLHQEREVFAPGIWSITGFYQQPCMVSKENTSPTTYTFYKKVLLFINAIVSFSDYPLRSIFNLGIYLSLFSSLYILYIIGKRIFWGSVVDGWTSVMASIWFLGGLIIMFIGVIGIYLSKVFLEVKQRPYTIIKKIYRNNNTPKSNR